MELRQEISEVERLLDDAVRIAGFASVQLFRVRAYDDDRMSAVELLLLQFSQHLDPRHLWNDEIEQDDVGPLFVRHSDIRGAVCRLFDDEAFGQEIRQK